MLNAQVCASARNSDGKYIGWTCKMGKHMEKWGPSIKASFARQNHHFGSSNFAPVKELKTWTKLRCCYTAMWLKILPETWIIISKSVKHFATFFFAIAVVTNRVLKLRLCDGYRIAAPGSMGKKETPYSPRQPRPKVGNRIFLNI